MTNSRSLICDEFFFEKTPCFDKGTVDQALPDCLKPFDLEANCKHDVEDAYFKEAAVAQPSKYGFLGMICTIVHAQQYHLSHFG